MIEKLTDFLIKRRMKNRHITINDNDDHKQQEFYKVLNSLRENKVMVFKEEDGIYIRIAGDLSKGECNSTEIVKVKSF